MFPGYRKGVIEGDKSGQEHGQRLQFPAEGIQHHAEGFEGDYAEKRVISGFAKDHRGRSSMIIMVEEGIAKITLDCLAISQGERFFAVGFYSQVSKRNRWHNGVHGAGVNQELDRNSLFGMRRVGDFDLQIG